MPQQTGPTSAAGKAVSSLNATTHNGCSERLIVEGERLEDYQDLVANLAGHYQPADAAEQLLVEDLAHDRWILWRRRRAFNNVEATSTLSNRTKPNGPKPNSNASLSPIATRPLPNAPSIAR